MRKPNQMNNTRNGRALPLVLALVLIGAMLFGLASSQQTRPFYPGAGTASRTFGWLKDFALDTDYNSTDFTTTLVEAGTGEGDPVQNDARYGTIDIITDENVDDATQIQSTNYCFKLTAGKHTTYTARFTTTATVSSCEYLWGLCGSDTTAIAGHANGFTIEKADASTSLKLVCVANGGGTSSDYTTFTGLATLVASTDYELVIDIMPLSSDISKAYIKVWLNNSLIFNRTVTTDISSSGTTYVLSPIAAARNKTDTVTTTGFVLDYMGAAQDR